MVEERIKGTDKAAEKNEKTATTASEAQIEASWGMGDLVDKQKKDIAYQKSADRPKTPVTGKFGTLEITDIPPAKASERADIAKPKEHLTPEEVKKAAECSSVKDAAKYIEQIKHPDLEVENKLRAEAAIEIIKARQVHTLSYEGVPWGTAMKSLASFGGIAYMATGGHYSGGPNDALGFKNRERLSNREKFANGEDVDIAGSTWDTRLAQCGEHAELLGSLLQESGVPGVEVMCVQDPKDAVSNHAFVVVGRKPDSDPKDPLSWGKAMVADSFGVDWNGSGHVIQDMNDVWTGGGYFRKGSRPPLMLHKPGTPVDFVK
jgi:hypothetical protein